jgi:transposase
MSSTSRTTTSSSRGSNRYPEEIRRQAVDLFNSSLSDHKTRQAAAKHVAGLLGVKCFDTVLTWARQAEIDSGSRAGITTEAAGELRRLRRENAELKRANAILKAASVFFAAELDRPPGK